MGTENLFIMIEICDSITGLISVYHGYSLQETNQTETERETEAESGI